MAECGRIPLSMTDLVYACCFCEGSIASTNVDPCALALVGNWRSPMVEERAEQQFFCHIACFRKAIRSNVPVAIEEMVADTLGNKPSAG